MAVPFHKLLPPGKDVLLAGATIVDGTGRDPSIGDVRLSGSIITEVGVDLARADATVVDTRGLVVSPGFIDLHAHSEGTLWRDPTHLPKIAQGVTLELLGQDGLGFAPVADSHQLGPIAELLAGWHGPWQSDDLTWSDLDSFSAALERRGLGINVGFLVPHGTIRMAAGALDSQPARPDQVRTMRQLLADGLTQGAFGLSTGLVYEPARHADFDELVALCSEVGADRIFVPHLRSYQQGALESYGEAFDVASRANTPLHLTHALLNGAINVGRAGELLSMMAAAEVRVTADVYPYAAGSTYLHVFLPPDLAGGAVDQVVSRLSSSDAGSRLEEATSHLDWDKLVVAGVGNRQLGWSVGMSISDVARQLDQPAVEAYRRILIEDRLSTTCVHFNGNWDNVSELLRSPRVCVASDSILVGERPHPRGWGAFARFIELFVATGEIPLGAGIHKLTGLPASIMDIRGRGVIAVGATADICCFDPAAVRDRSSFDDPKVLAQGFEHVFVRGQPVLWHQEPTRLLPGEVVRP